MNTPGAVMSCQTNKKTAVEMPSWLPGCIPMNESTYGLVTSIYSIGGLIGSFYTSKLADTKGRKGAGLINCAGFILGPILMALSPNVWILALGRVLSGLSSGAVRNLFLLYSLSQAMVLVPLYINEISPKNLRGAFGVTCQLFVVVGIVIVQLLSLYLSSIPYWRLILLFGGIIGCTHFTLLLFASESPKWVALQTHGQLKASAILRRIRGEDSDHEVREWRRRCMLSVESDGILIHRLRIVTLYRFG
jgi:MFS family permease